MGNNKNHAFMSQNTCISPELTLCAFRLQISEHPIKLNEAVSVKAILLNVSIVIRIFYMYIEILLDA